MPIALRAWSGGLIVQGLGLPARLAGDLATSEIALSGEEIARNDARAGPDGRIVSPQGLAPEGD